MKKKNEKCFFKREEVLVSHSIARELGVKMAAPSEVRADGRRPAMMRQLTTERGLLTRADGSARWEQGASGALG